MRIREGRCRTVKNIKSSASYGWIDIGKLRLSFTCFALLFFIPFVSFSNELLYPFVSAIIHESGHLLFIYLFRLKLKRVIVFPFGIELVPEKKTAGYLKETLMLSGGPVANLLFAFVSSELNLSAAFCVPETLVYSSYIYAFLNLMPIRSLDGGRMVENALLAFFSLEKAVRISRMISGVALFVLYAFAVLLFYYSAFNFTLLFFVMYLFYSTVLLTV